MEFEGIQFVEVISPAICPVGSPTLNSWRVRSDHDLEDGMVLSVIGTPQDKKGGEPGGREWRCGGAAGEKGRLIRGRLPAALRLVFSGERSKGPRDIDRFRGFCSPR